jgi:hypothetical protein
MYFQLARFWQVEPGDWGADDDHHHHVQQYGLLLSMNASMGRENINNNN